MKKGILIILSVIVFSNLIAQTFTIESTKTTLVKSTSQSPAHWYLEIENNTATEHTLRWKFKRGFCPSAWVFSFDDQSNFYPSLLKGDSADFLLEAGGNGPHKLIIGNTFNESAGNGSAYFEIFDVANPSYRINIEYEFIVNANETVINEQNVLAPFFVNRDVLYIAASLIKKRVQIFALNGALKKDFIISSDKVLLDIQEGIYLILCDGLIKRISITK